MKTLESSVMKKPLDLLLSRNTLALLLLLAAGIIYFTKNQNSFVESRDEENEEREDGLECACV